MKCNYADVLKIAAGEIGYKEKKSNKDLDSKTANAGSGNYTKYARDINGYWGNKQGFDWCTQFVVWAFMMASYKTPAEAKADGWKDVKAVQPYGLYGASCTWQTKYYKEAGIFYSTPQVGDQAFFTRGHTGIVESFNGKTLVLIEGNSGNQVAQRSYSWPNSQFSGFGRPRYATASPAVAIKPSIAEGPNAVTANEGATAVFTVKASGSSPAYQWQYSLDGGKEWRMCTLSGYKTAKLSVNALAYRDGYMYRCIVSNSAGSVTSGSAKLTVAIKPTITGNPESVTAEIGETVYFVVTATGPKLSYQWEYSTDGGKTFKNWTLHTKAAESVKATKNNNGCLYRCVVKNQYGSAVSKTAKLTVREALAVGYSVEVVPDIGLNIRKGPGTAYAKVTALKQGSVAKVYEERNGWGRISYNGVYGWISLEYTKRV